VIKRLVWHPSIQVTDGYGSRVNFDQLRADQQKIVDMKSKPQLVVAKKRWA
jgi:hypothetical protein